MVTPFLLQNVREAGHVAIGDLEARLVRRVVTADLCFLNDNGRLLKLRLPLEAAHSLL